MKLPTENIHLEQQLAEFDIWITPSLREIQDSEKFKSELERVDTLLLSLGQATENFQSVESCSASSIASTCVSLIEERILEIEDISQKIVCCRNIIESLFSLLFLSTGKSDNNFKCQFPVFLLQNTKKTTFPKKMVKKGKVSFVEKELGRIIKSETIAILLTDALAYSRTDLKLKYLEEEARFLLAQYVRAILIDEASVKQFWALGRSYFNLHSIEVGAAKSLLAPMVIFKVKGSVSASGGHIPEDLLRDMMETWGLDRGVDFNTDDVVIRGTESGKTRAYDFILPYKTSSWANKIFVQCQFYAGDSGSVSHKNVDQTKASRPDTLKQYPDAIFVEFLDGAGYYASLNGDLKHLLKMENTKTFFQIRSAHIKLRRELQSVGFIAPVELEHAIFRSKSGQKEEVESILISEGYSVREIERAIESAYNRRIIIVNDNTLSVSQERLEAARRLFLIDLIAQNGRALPDGMNAGKLLIPGYGPFYGIELANLSSKIGEVAPNLNYSRNEFAEDITWLSEQKLILNG